MIKSSSIMETELEEMFETFPENIQKEIVNVFSGWKCMEPSKRLARMTYIVKKIFDDIRLRKSPPSKKIVQIAIRASKQIKPPPKWKSPQSHEPLPINVKFNKTERRVQRFIESPEGQYLRKYCLKEYYDALSTIRSGHRY